jgi:hypothetical protein
MKTLLSFLAMIGIASAGSLKIDNGSSWLKVDCKATGHSWTAQLKKFTASASGDEATPISIRTKPIAMQKCSLGSKIPAVHGK